MNRNGEPETDMEKWMLDAGLGFCYAVQADEELTKAQTERLSESTPQPDTNPLHHWIAQEFASHYNHDE